MFCPDPCTIKRGISEALQRLFLQRFLNEVWKYFFSVIQKLFIKVNKKLSFFKYKPNIPENLINVSAEPETFNDSLLKSRARLLKEYDDFRQHAVNGGLGKTPQFWLTYLNLARLQHQARTSVHTNDFEMRLDVWERILPFYFFYNKTNYSRYGTYYVQLLKKLDANLIDLLKTTDWLFKLK